VTHADALRAELARAARTLGAPDDVSPILERPRDPAFGDWATNLAMTLAKPLGKKPRDIAETLIAALDRPSVGIVSAEIAGPGFINIRLDPGYQARGLLQILAAPEQWGRLDIGQQQRVCVEFVSANPTGPLHVGHGRQAALGDAISTLLEWTGWNVDREFYYNDAGAQIANLAKSTQARVRELVGHPLEIPEGGYHGAYIAEIAERYVQQHPEDRDGNDLDALRQFAVAALRHEQDLDLQAFGVKFDTYYLESSLYTDGRVEQTVEALKASGHTYEEDGALFLRTTTFGDDKDRVMKKSAAKGGDYTYFVPDVAYHVTKWERGYTRAINVQGADHHSTTTRVRAGLQALGIGIPQGYPDYVLQGRRRGEDLQARRVVRHRARSHRRGGTRCRALLLPHAQGRLPARVRRGPRAQPVGRKPGVLHPDGARPHVRHLPRGRDPGRDRYRRRRGSGRAQRASRAGAREAVARFPRHGEGRGGQPRATPHCRVAARNGTRRAHLVPQASRPR
jgi:arginyl-tRNA synthetase